jgi:hypothetical protein
MDRARLTGFPHVQLEALQPEDVGLARERRRRTDRTHLAHGGDHPAGWGPRRAAAGATRPALVLLRHLPAGFIRERLPSVRTTVLCRTWTRLGDHQLHARPLASASRRIHWSKVGLLTVVMMLMVVRT